MEELQLKRVTIDAINQLQQIGRQTFAETFSSDNSEEDMEKYLAEGFSTGKLKSELSDENSEFYFAELNGRVIGYLKINFGAAQTEIKHEHALEIERIYVLREFHGKNIGQQLCEKALEIAVQKEVEYVWLGVWEKNPRAIRFYEKNGFLATGKHVFKLGDDEQTDIIMKREI